MKEKKEKKLNWMNKMALKKAIKVMKRKFGIIIEKREKKNAEKTKAQLQGALWSMTDVLTIYDDDEGTIPLTKELLKEKTTDQLIKLFNEVLTEAERISK